MKFCKSYIRGVYIAIGIASSIASVYLLLGHIEIITMVRSVSLPTLASISTLENTATVLQKQVELAELQASKHSSLAEEQLAAYVLPAKFDIDRLVAAY
jgi:hypothetical protein